MLSCNGLIIATLKKLVRKHLRNVLFLNSKYQYIQYM